MHSSMGDNPGFVGAASVSWNVERTPYGRFTTQTPATTRTLLAGLISEFPNTAFCEIGVFGGANLFALYDVATQHGVEIIGIDPHDKIEIHNGVPAAQMPPGLAVRYSRIYAGFRNHIERAITMHNLGIRYINDTSWNVHGDIADASIGVLHVDGDHSYDGVRQDLALFASKMTVPSVIVMDDYNWAPIQRATKEFAIAHALTVEPVENGTKCVMRIGRPLVSA